MHCDLPDPLGDELKAPMRLRLSVHIGLEVNHGIPDNDAREMTSPNVVIVFQYFQSHLWSEVAAISL